jgi:hypothetical protein
LTDLPFELKAFAKEVNSPLRPFWLRISVPEVTGEFDYQCEIVCPTIRDTPMTIFGSEPLFTAELSVQFVRQSLDHLGIVLVDTDGGGISLPKFDDIPDSTLKEVNDDGSREAEGILVSLKETKSGERILCIDDVRQTLMEGKEAWGERSSFTLLPLEQDLSEEQLAAIGWNIVTRLDIRRAAPRKKPKA